MEYNIQHMILGVGAVLAVLVTVLTSGPKPGSGSKPGSASGTIATASSKTL